ncbi:MAG TPA: rod shape-determining protein [Solirubrobacteraceae bacterium]
MRFRSSFAATRDVAIDLGTANTLVYLHGKGVVRGEPSVVAMDEATGQVHAVGEEAKRMIGRTPSNISAILPLRHGVIADLEVAESMLRHFLEVVRESRFTRPRLVLCAPSGITDVERRALVEASEGAGARAVALIEEPIAAAIGAGLAIDEPSGRMVVDIGGGTSEMAVISLGGMVVEESLRVGGYDFDEAIGNHLRVEHRLAVGSQTAEALKLQVGSAWSPADRGGAEVRGRDIISGLPHSVLVDSSELRAAYAEPLQAIVDAVKATLERTPPELAGDIVNGGIMLAGGGSLLPGLDDLIAAETGIEVSIAAEPLACVCEGAGASLDDFDTVLRASKNWMAKPRRVAAEGA